MSPYLYHKTRLQGVINIDSHDESMKPLLIVVGLITLVCVAMLAREVL